MSNTEKNNILVIDDDIVIRKLLKHHLINNEYNVIEAAGPEEGMNHMSSNPIDLVLCDVTMDGMDGFTFCRKVRENEKYRAIPFVFVTAKNTMEDKSMALDAGGDDIITKPFDVNELLLKVKALIKRTAIYKIYGVKKNLEQYLVSTANKILLVDDDISLIRIFEYNLTKSGFECVVAESAEDAFNKMKHFVPDLILSDIMMPGTDGFQFRKELLKNDKLKTIPFIFLTAKGEEDDILEGYEFGITDYVVKTAGPKLVVAKVNAILKSLGKERSRIVTELHAAADSLRVKVVPDSAPTFDGFYIKHWHKPFQGIPGGDFIDFFPLDKNNLAVILGDVMGKKWGAWFFAFAYAGYVRTALRMVLQNSRDFSPGKILTQVNKSVYEDAKISEVFATLSIVVINNEKKIIKYAGAGDLPVLYKNTGKEKIEKIISAGALLGFNPRGEFDDLEIQIQPDDFIIMLTDGLIESRNSDNNPLGTEGLIKILTDIKTEKDPLARITKDINNFTGGKFEDDVSLIVIKAV
ncbi:MAG TPA: response regulator [Ignavibacteriaceae bacterium]|nr:response regulator [Ignavibacteriaceae bacterium]